MEKTALKTLWAKEKMVEIHIFSFTRMFSSLPNTSFNFWVTITLLSANVLNLDQSKILSFGEGFQMHLTKKIDLCQSAKSTQVDKGLSDSLPGGCEFDPQLRWTFFPMYFSLSPLQKHVRKVVCAFRKRSCVSTGIRKPGNTCASPTAMIWP